MHGGKQALAFQAKRQTHHLWLCSCCTDEKFAVRVGNDRAFTIMLASPDTMGMYFVGFCRVSHRRNGMRGKGRFARLLRFNVCIER